MTALSRHLFSVLREGELALYRGSGDSLEPMLLVAPVGEYSAHESRAMAGMTLVLEHQELCPRARGRPWLATPRRLLVLFAPECALVRTGALRAGVSLRKLHIRKALLTR